MYVLFCSNVYVLWLKFSYLLVLRDHHSCYGHYCGYQLGPIYVSCCLALIRLSLHLQAYDIQPSLIEQAH